MTVQITHTHSTEQTTRCVSVGLVGAEDYRRPYSKLQTLRPAQLTITFVRNGENPWIFRKADLSGPRVLVNGQLTQTLTDTIPHWEVERAPGWVQKLVTGHLDALNEKLLVNA